MGVAQARKHFLTFEGTATDDEFSLNSTFIHVILLLPEMFTRPRQGANDLFFVFRIDHHHVSQILFRCHIRDSQTQPLVAQDHHCFFCKKKGHREFLPF